MNLILFFVVVPIIKCPQFAISKDMNENIKSNIITTQWKGEKPRDKDSGAEERNSNKQWESIYTFVWRDYFKGNFFFNVPCLFRS